MQNKRKNLFTVGMLSGLVALSVGLTGCGKGQTAEDFISEAKTYQQKGDTKAAIIQLKNAVQKNPEDGQARYLLGMSYSDAGDALSAEKELRKALSLGVDRSTVAPALGTSLYLLGRYQKVLEETEPLLASKPDAELYALRGDAYLALNRPAEAKKSFEQALKENSDFPEAMIGLARHALLQGDFDVAMRFAENAIKSNPKNTRAWFFKGELLRAQAKTEPALAAFDELLKLKPDDARGLIAKATLEINGKKFDAARANIAAAKKSAPGDMMVVYTQALLDHAEGKHAAAWESLQQVLRVAPDHLQSNLLAGSVQHALGATQQAEFHLKKVLEKEPGNVAASRTLVASLLKGGDAQRATDALRATLKYAPRDPQLLALAGEASMRSQDYGKATDFFEKASIAAPQASIIRTALGVSRLAQGDNAGGIADLEISADLDPKASQASVTLVMTHLKNREYDRAFAAARKLEKAQPSNPLVHNLKGMIHAAKKDMAAARGSFDKALSLQPNYFPAVANLVQLDLQEKKLDVAKNRLEAVLETDKTNTAAMIAMAGVVSLQGRKDEVTSWLERASNEKPGDVRPALILANHYIKAGEKAKALALAQKVQAANPSNPDALDLLAQAQLANDDKRGALQSYSKLTVLVPNSPVVQLRLAAVHMRVQDESAAIDALKKALSIKPDYQEAQLALASIEARRGNQEQALSVARQMQKQSAKSPTGYELEGDLLMAQKKPVPAAKAYEQALARSKSGLTMIKIHEALRQSGRQKEGDSRLAGWVRQNPSYASVRIHLGAVYLGTQQSKAAIEQFEAVLRQNPKNIAALNNIALAFQQQKDPRAREYAENAYALAAESAPIVDTLGWILVEQGNTARGLPLLQKAASLAPASQEIRYHLAAALAKSGDNAAARKELAQVLDSGKTFAKLDEAKALQKQLQ